MLNREKYAEEILNIACKGDKIAICNGKLTACDDTHCINCDFRRPSECQEKMLKWVNSEYVEPPVDWSKVSVDTPIYVRCRSSDEWEKKHFAKFENNCVYAWSDGKTSWSTTNGSTMVWEHAKLAESEDQNGNEQN